MLSRGKGRVGQKAIWDEDRQGRCEKKTTFKEREGGSSRDEERKPV